MHILAAIAAVILTAALAWFAGRSYSRSSQPPAPPPSFTAAAATPTPTAPQPSPSPVGYRLAGTVVGDVRYAVIEDSHGENELYRPGQVVPDLGSLVEVEPHVAIFESDGRRFELHLTSAATPTPEPTPDDTPVDEDDGEDVDLTQPSSDPDRQRDPEPESDSSDSESSSSDDSDRPAS